MLHLYIKYVYFVYSFIYIFNCYSLPKVIAFVDKCNIMKKNNSSKTFPEYYDSLDKKEQKILRGKILKRSRISRSSFYKYVEGARTPKYGTQVLIAQVVGAKVSELFPEDEQ